jgi:hypothetical protein
MLLRISFLKFGDFSRADRTETRLQSRISHRYFFKALADLELKLRGFINVFRVVVKD